MKTYDLVIIGGGPAGMFAATQAYKRSIHNILIVERGKELGGMLNQCIHSGFGTGEFDKELTGTEFAYKMTEKIEELGIEYLTETSVFEITKEKRISTVSHKEGIQEIQAKSIILSTGAMERPRGSMNILGSKMSGIFTAGSVQRFINEQGVLPGKKVVVLGSRDMGMVVARQLKIEGANVIGVYEFKNYVGGTNKVYKRCIKDFEIPLYLRHTVIGLQGDERLKGVYIAEVDARKRFIEGTEKFVTCDTLVLSVGLEPIHDIAKKMKLKMNEETKSPLINSDFETSVEGVFVCGNALHVHDYIDNIREESKECVKSVVKYLSGESEELIEVELEHDENIKYLIPNAIKLHKKIENKKKDFSVKFKFKDKKENVVINIYLGEKLIYKEQMKSLSSSETKWLDLSETLFLEYKAGEKLYLSVDPLEV